ncbi:reticulocyte-binding protein 3 isoform X2 [Acyrthosiphon pisum]|uniref:Daxx histone-binding domain-containing protein n=1 Tax=Acyrthosiphon pisum TaxID=7029 RepID=A0A8R2A8C9_ACYPI|nr:reticulocyte-binding protein 3 isoform X2 [Acyrthosiphon pisum]|eukprot:XP_003241599.1 PREDICTED: reticulocyte-binding protein 3 isoform X2 [Acyrthosiphon pisum]
MSEIEISSGLEDSEPDISYNKDLFQQMINLCRNNKQFPQPYIEDMNKMYKKCNYKQKKSKHLCDLILKGIEFISPKNNDSFQYAASVYNELLRLSEKDSTNLQTENCVASTSNGNASMITELENDTSNNEISESDKIFKELIEKCYQNTHFPKSNIDVIDNLYKSLPSEFLGSKYFIMLLREANQVIWPDSGSPLYTHMEHIYEQLQQFKTSMKVQDSRTSVTNKQMDEKTLKQLKKLKYALKIIRKKIKNLEEKEMDINNENEFNSDSAYILKDKYEKRIVEIYKRMCKLKEEPDFLEEPMLHFKATNDRLVNKTIEKYYNLNKTFPDYFEIYTLLQCLRDKKKLKWTETDLKNISHDAFLKLGKQLKLRRLNEYFGRLANVNTIKDPAEENEELKRKLDESNKKLHSDLNALTLKFKNKQDYAEETEGSNLNNTECEYSSESDCTNNNKKYNKELKPIKPISVKRKRLSSPASDNDKPPKKSQKTIYMESFDLAPSGVTPETILNKMQEETTVITEKVPDQTTTINGVNNIIINKIYSIPLGKDGDYISKNADVFMSNGETCGVNKKASVEITLIDVDDTTNKKNKICTKKVSEKVTKCINNTDETLGNNNLVPEVCLDDTDSDRTLVIDEDIRTKEPQEKKIIEVGSELNATNHSTIDSENYDPIITEPEVIIHEGKNLRKDVIEINELDDSDVEITSCETSIVPVQNKKSLESIIKAMNFHKKYNWNKESKKSNPIPPPVVAKTLHQNSTNLNQNLNNNLVNRWVMNNIRPPKPSSTSNIPNLRHNNRQPTTYQGMRSTSFQNSVQTARQYTQRISNMVQQQRHFNNQSVLQEQVTTMTTTTTVRQIVQKNQVHLPGNSVTNGGNKPELIELD